ncbi:MAG: hypothetical protein ABIN91_22510 [Mucilaginibacter sp.]|uniref:hypothetical protein n=1 Tax=Mucilaginibacter sp. TaxID=1882438 RepID=UPI00326628D1
MKKLVTFSLGLICLLYACKKDKEKSVNVNGIDPRRLEIRKQIALHNKGMQYFLSKMSGIAVSQSTSSVVVGPGPGDPTGPTTPIVVVPLGFVNNTINDFLAIENVPSTGLGIVSNDLSSPNSTILSTTDYNVKLSEDFYRIALNIINTQGSSVTEITTHIDSLVTSGDFLALPQIEKDILYVGSETFIASYTYWSNAEGTWTPVIASLSPGRVQTKGFWGSVWSTAKADGKGAIAGAIGGAIGGAVAGVMIGGIGAGPGAAAGAVGVGLATGITNSILHVWNFQVAYTDPTTGGTAIAPITNLDGDVLVDNLTVPEMWTKISIDSSVPVPSTIQYNQGVFTIN